MKLSSRRRSRNRLKEENQRVGGVPKTSEAKEFDVEGRPPNLIDGLIPS